MYQLVLQIPANTIRDYDALVALEEELIAELGENAVDGHDMGSGEANIFLLTCHPQKTFQEVFPILERSGYISQLNAAYRSTDEDQYYVVWPKHSRRPFSVA